jgi:hypothetical protein
MPKVIIIPYNQVEKVCQDAMTFANSCQSDFTFYILPPTKKVSSILSGHTAEVFDVLKYLEEQKIDNGYEKEDLILTFYNGTLKATSHGLTNLFCAGSRYDEDYPCTGVISLQYLGWDILEEKYNYEVQKHSILHLIVCGMFGAYTHLEPHRDIGCLLDLNLRLPSFNLKLRRGYYLCSSHEFDCYEKIKKEKYGKAILKLCETFKNGNNYQTIIEQLIMIDNSTGDKIQVGDISNNSGQIVIGKNIQISNSVVERKEIASKIEELIKSLRQEPNIEDEKRQTLITNFDKVKEEVLEDEPDKSRIHKWLSTAKSILETFVLSHHVTEAVHWVFKALTF